MGNVVFKKNWDSAISWIDIENETKKRTVFIKNDPYFRIQNFIKRRKSGSLLLSGERGVGKTTSILQAIQGVRASVFPIYINALHLESLEGEGQNFFAATLFLRQIASRFSNLAKSKGYSTKKLDETIRNAYATEVIWRKETSGRTTAGGDLSGAATIQSGFLSGGASLSGSHERISKFTRSIGKTGYTIEDFSKDFSSSIQEIEKKNLLSKRKIATLNKKINKFDLSLRIRKLTDSPLEVVFIVDELDYYDESKDPGPVGVLKAIKKFKNLFTLSSAHFIFIVGKKTYKTSVPEASGFNTLFSEKIFISKIRGSELEKFLNSIVKDKDKLKKNKKWNLYKWYLISQSKHNYYNLIQEIKSRLVVGEKTDPYLLLDNPGFEEEEAAIHYALNTFYERYMEDQRLKHYHSEDLFGELSKVEDNFKHWIHGEGVLKIDLKLQVETEQPEIRGVIRSAQRSFIRYLLKLGGADAPEQLKQPELAETEIPWDQARKGLTFELVKRGIRGAVLDDEINFVDLCKVVLVKIAQILNLNENKKEQGDLPILLNEAKNKLALPIENDWIDQINKIHNSIAKDLFHERENINKTKSALDILQRIDQMLDSRIGKLDGLAYRIDSGNVGGPEKGDKIVLTGNGKIAFLLDPPKKNFVCTMGVELPEGSIADLLLYTHYGSTPEEDEYYMFRVDTRNPSPSVGDGLLLKQKGKGMGGWNYIDDKGDFRKSTIPNKKLVIKLERKNNTIVFSKRQGGGRYSKIATINKKIGIKLMGTLQEGEGAIITSFKLRRQDG